MRSSSCFLKGPSWSSSKRSWRFHESDILPITVDLWMFSISPYFFLIHMLLPSPPRLPISIYEHSTHLKHTSTLTFSIQTLPTLPNQNSRLSPLSPPYTLQPFTVFVVFIMFLLVFCRWLHTSVYLMRLGALRGKRQFLFFFN